MKNIASASVFALGLGASSFAGLAQAVNLDLPGLKAKCAELSADEQLKPFKAVVTCKQVVTEWRPSSQTANPSTIANTKEIGASFSLKSYAVPFESESIDVSPSQYSCTILEQVKATVPAVDMELDCAALDQVQKLSDLCGPIIEERLAADPGIEVVEPTGKIFNSCTGQQTVSEGQTEEGSQSESQVLNNQLAPRR